MPKGKSIYETYFDPGASTGEYVSSLRRVSDVWSDIDFSRERSTWETEQREKNLDTILAATELGATVGGSMVGFKEGSAAIAKETGEEPIKIGRGGEPWEKGKFENLWQKPRYKFGEDVVMSKSEIRKYGRDVKEFGKYGVDIPLDVYKDKSMHAEYRQGYERPEGDWYPGKHAKGALGVAKKAGQTIVPGGKTGYGDLYSGIGKKAADIVTTTPEKVTETETEVRSSGLAGRHLIPEVVEPYKSSVKQESDYPGIFGGEAEDEPVTLESFTEDGREQTLVPEIPSFEPDPEYDALQDQGGVKETETKLSFDPVPLENLKKEQLTEFMNEYHPEVHWATNKRKYGLYAKWFKGLSK